MVFAKLLEKAYSKSQAGSATVAGGAVIHSEKCRPVEVDGVGWNIKSRRVYLALAEKSSGEMLMVETAFVAAGHGVLPVSFVFHEAINGFNKGG